MDGIAEWTSVASTVRYQRVEDSWYAPSPELDPDAKGMSAWVGVGAEVENCTTVTRIPRDALPPPTARALPIKSWVERIGKDSASFSTSKGVRTHRLYKLILKAGKEALRGVLSALDTAPTAATIIAFDIVGKDAAPITREDYGKVWQQVQRWKIWGQQNKYLP